MAHNARRHCGPIQAQKRKEKYSRQWSITERNRKRKLLKHLKNKPDDKLAIIKAKKLGIIKK